MDLTFLTRLIGLAILVLPAAYGGQSSLSSSISEPPSISTITIGGQIFVVDPANYVLDGTTVRPGSAGISIDGQVVSADAAHDLFVDGREILGEPTSSIIVSTTAINRTAILSSSNVVLPGSVSASSVPAAAAASGFNVLGGEVAHIAVQAASTHTIYAVRDAFTTSISASMSAATAFSSGSAPLQPAMISSASSVATSSSLSTASTAGAFANVQAKNSLLQSRSTVSVSMSAPSPRTNLIPTNTFIHNNSSSRLVAVAGVSKRSQSASSSPHSMGPTGTPSRSPKTLPGAQSKTITTGPTIAIPTASVASSQGLLLVGAIFGITEEAKTLSAIIKDDVSKVSFISKVKETSDDILDSLEQIHTDEDLPSYEEACLDGASIFDIFKDLGCLKGAFDEVKGDLEDKLPDVPKIQIIFDNVGKLAENLEKEEEEDDDDEDDDGTSTSETDLQASKTEETTTNRPSSSLNTTPSTSTANVITQPTDTTRKRPSTSISNTPSVTLTASSRMSSGTSTANVTMPLIDKNPIVDSDMSDYSFPEISDQAFMGFLGDVLSSAVGIGPGPSGFAVVIGNAKATANSSSSAMISSAMISSIPTTVRASSSAQIVSSAAVAAGSNTLDGEISHVAVQLTTIHATLTLGVTVTPLVSKSAAAKKAEDLGGEIAAIAKQIASASAAAVASAKTTSTSLANSPVSSPTPAGSKWGIYLAYQVYTWGGIDVTTDYYYKVWMTDLTKDPAGPDFCAAYSWIVQTDGAVTSVPTEDFNFAIPAGILESTAIACKWQPSPEKPQPGSITCDRDVEKVLCTVPATTAVTCKGDNPDRILPFAQCVWQ